MVVTVFEYSLIVDMSSSSSSSSRPSSNRSSLQLCTPTCPCASGNTSLEALGHCAAYPRILGTLQKYFGHDTFRPGQLDAVLPTVHGRDVFVRMATGGGKSLCMFLVPLSISNAAMGVIVSPLNGLMDEHVRWLSHL